MQKDLRKSGIELIGDVPWGMHLCQFYQTKQDLIDILAPYFKAGLENDEFCMWITAEPLGVKEAKAALQERVKDLDAYIRKGQIEILDYKAWYLKSGRFDASEVLEGWVAKERDALKNGFKGLRLTGNTFWLEESLWKTFVDYEETVNGVIGKHMMLAVCSYSLDKCAASEIIDVVSNHQFAIIKKSDKWIRVENSEHKKVLETLEKSEEKYRIVIDNTYDWEYWIGPDKRFIYCSPSCKRITGYGPEDFINDPDLLERIIVPEDRPAFLSCHQETLKYNLPGAVEFRIVRADGEIRRILHVYQPVFDKAGNYLGIRGSNRDITERKNAEEALKKNVQLLRDTGEMAKVGGWEFDLSTKEVLLTEEVSRIHGVEAGYKLMLEEALNFYAPESRPDVAAAVKKAAETGEPYDLESLFIPSGSKDKIWIRSLGRAVYSGDKIVKLQGTFQNIDKYKRAEEALRESEERYRILFETMPVTVTVTTPEGKLVSSNHAIGDMLGYTPQEFAAINMSDLYVDPGERRRMIAILQEKGKVRDLEVKFRRKDGTIIFALINIEWITIGGQRLILSTGRDITERKAAEERLRESEDLFRHVSSTTSDIAYSCVGTREGGYAIQWMSGAVKDITGYTIEELKARRCWGTIVIEEDAALFREHIANLGPGVSATCELRIRAKNGAVVWVVSHVKCAIDPDDSAKLRLYGALVDITERKVVEEALRESEERYRIQFEQTIDALFLADTQTGIILDCNRAAIELMGREKSEMVGQHQRMLHPPEEWDKKFSKSFTQHISGETVAETKVIKKSGEIRDVAIKASTFDLKGKKVILAIFHDITERKKAEEALKDSEEMFRKVFRESPIGMMLFDENGKLADINSACVEILGISDVKKTLNMDLFDDPNLPEMIKRTVKAGERVRHEIEYNFEKVKESHYYKTSKSGRIELDVIIVPVSFGKKKTRGYLAHMQDITRRKHAEEDLRKTYFQLKEAQDEFIQSEKMAALGRFASGIAHEVKNPLGVILGGVELLDRKLKKADADTKTALAKIKESVLRANNILLDLLQYAKPSKKKFESIELKEIISTVAPLIKFKISPNTVISLELAKERICCNADNNQMQQVILNVVLNAVEAMPEGGIVTIRTYTSKPSELFPGKKACVIEVIDTGTGISKEDMTKVSEPFFTTKIGRKGTGLGLFMARTMIANHGGKLLIESEKGKGTSVKIVLPLAKTKKETEDEEDTGDR